MSNDIRINTSFFSNLKTKKLRKVFGGEGIISLIVLWMYAAENNPKGDLTGMTAEDIATITDWEGDPTEYLDTLVSIGFLDRDKGGLVIHDWEKHNPWVFHAQERSQRAKKNVEKRWLKSQTPERNSDGREWQEAEAIMDRVNGEN